LANEGLALLDIPELAAEDTRWERAFALLTMAEVREFSGTDEVLGQPELLKQSLVLFQELGDDCSAAHVMRTLAWVLGGRERRVWLHKALDTLKAVGDVWGSARALAVLGMDVGSGDLEEGRGLLTEAIMMMEEELHIEAPEMVGALGWIHYFNGRFDEALPLLERSVAALETGDPGQRRILGQFLCGALLGLGKYDRTEAEAARISLDPAVAPIAELALVREAHLKAHQHLTARASEARRSDHWYQLGHALPLLVYAARGLGKQTEARAHLREALANAADHASRNLLLAALQPAALLLCDERNVERGIEVSTLAFVQWPFAASSRWFEDVAGKHIAAAAEGLPAEVVAAAQKRGRERDLWETARELLDELEEKGEA
jgi:tetratricopeptide (TPR) repeat protein